MGKETTSRGPGLARWAFYPKSPRSCTRVGPIGRSFRDHDGELDEARLPGRVVHPLGGLAVVGGLRPEDALDEGLGVPVVEREPARLHLHHDAVTRAEDVV